MSGLKRVPLFLKRVLLFAFFFLFDDYYLLGFYSKSLVSWIPPVMIAAVLAMIAAGAVAANNALGAAVYGSLAAALLTGKILQVHSRPTEDQ